MLAESATPGRSVGGPARARRRRSADGATAGVDARRARRWSLPARGRARSPACASASRPPARSASPSESRSRASRRSTRCCAGDGVDVACVDARRGEVFAAGAGLELCRRSRPRRSPMLLAPGAVLAGDGAVRYRDLLEPAAVIPPDDSPLHTSRGPGTTPRSPARRARPSRSTCARPMPTARSQRGPPHDDRRRAAARCGPVRPRPRSSELERARLPDAVVALDVRRRARQAERHLPGGVPGRGHARLPDRRPLRRRLARHERRGRSAVARARRRPACCSSACSSSPARTPTAATRSRCASRTPVAIHLYESLGFVDDRRPPRLLHRQPRGRADHVADPEPPA